MGLVSEYVDVKVNAFTYNYYKELGYDIPMRLNSKGELKIDTSKYIQVKASDLRKNSHQVVKVICDACGKELDVIYENYNKVISKHDEYLCVSCANERYNSGENNGNWNPLLKNDERMDRRINPAYNIFIRSVLNRDSYTCQCCGSHNKNTLIVHHLDGYNWCYDKRYDETNAITLCKNCHNNFHLKYGYGNNTKDQFLEWLGLVDLELQINKNILPTTKKVYCYEDEMIYDSVSEAKFKNGYKSLSNIYNVCNHKQKYYTAYGKHWFWYDEYINLSEEEKLKYISL